jgi:hypothetical protein
MLCKMTGELGSMEPATANCSRNYRRGALQSLRKAKAKAR